MEVRVLPAEESLLVQARAVAEVAFASPTTQVGDAGPQARDAQVPEVTAARAEALVARARVGVTVTVGAGAPDGGLLASGQHQPVRRSSEIVAVATLPSLRRRGLAAAITSGLVQHAFGHGMDLVLLVGPERRGSPRVRTGRLPPRRRRRRRGTAEQ